jgi:hypothetical protein
MVPTKVPQVRITAELDPQVDPGRRGHVAGHDRGRTAKKGEGRAAHPSISHWDQIGQTALVLARQDRQGIRAFAPEVDFCKGLEGNGLSP